MPHVRVKKGWDWIPDSETTSERVFLNRRMLLTHLGFSGMAALLSGSPMGAEPSSSYRGPYGHVPEAWLKRWKDLFPAVRNSRFKIQRAITDERLFAGHNNFYEFSLDKKRVKDMVDSFKVSPWQVKISGEVEKKGKYDLDDLIRMGQLEERLYHFRCVEAWSANVPWTGYPLSQLIEKLKPTSKAKYVRFVSVWRPGEMPGQKKNTHRYPWPYYEALSMEEAMNELALLTFGIYGHPLNKQNGAPVRMVLPWKYGFKSIKSIVKIEFVKKQPRTFWGDSSPEYGFYANTNPKYSHPRWSQARETFLNTNRRIPTRIYNGYGQYVAHMYDENDRNYFF